MSQFLDQIVPCLETSSFQGKRFWASHTSKWLKLPDPSKETKINLITMPYFSLGKTPERRNRSHSSKAHWIQPLVQSAYHLDSSISRENQQAIRCLYDHIIDVLHVSQLWILTIGDSTFTLSILVRFLVTLFFQTLSLHAHPRPYMITRAHQSLHVQLESTSFPPQFA